MVLLLLILLFIGIFITVMGAMNANLTLLNLGLSWISGTIVGVFCNFAISMHYRKRDKSVIIHNQNIAVQKNTLMEQYNSLQELIVYYVDIISNLNAYFSSNKNVQDQLSEVGYFELCKSLWNLPTVIIDDKLLDYNEIEDINEAQRRLALIKINIDDKEFSKIRLTDECMFALGFVSRCSSTIGKIKAKLDALNESIIIN